MTRRQRSRWTTNHELQCRPQSYDVARERAGSLHDVVETTLHLGIRDRHDRDGGRVRVRRLACVSACGQVIYEFTNLRIYELD